MSAIERDTLVVAPHLHAPFQEETRSARAALRAVASPARRRYLASLAVAVSALGAGFVALFVNAAVVAALPVATVGTAVVTGVALASLRADRRLDRAAVALAGLWAVAGGTIAALPTYLYGGGLNGVVHASAIAAPLLLATGALTASWSTRRVLGNTPGARDLAVYPILGVPVVLALVAYGLLLGRVVVEGAGGLTLDVLVRAWGQTQDGAEFTYTVGLRNQLLGSVLLMVLTCAISIVPGVAAAVYLSEYPGAIARVIRFCTTMLRAISVFIIGVALAGVVAAASGLAPESVVSQLVRGTFVLGDGAGVQAGRGSFVAAAAFLSLLVIPIIARFTEEGLRSVPREMREGTVATGATAGYGLRRVLLPWALPNLVTGLLLGAAEAAGSLAIIMFAAGNGEHGVGLTSPVTALDYALFATRYGTSPFIQSMGYRAPVDYAYTCALLLLGITLGLTLLAMLVRRRFAKRYRGTLTLG